NQGKVLKINSLAHLQGSTKDALCQYLQLHLECGVDEIISNMPVDRLAINQKEIGTKSMHQAQTIQNQEKKISPHKNLDHVRMGIDDGDAQKSLNSPDPIFENDVIKAQKLADSCHDLDSLKQAVEQFDGCALKDTATSLVFGDGARDGHLMVIGEAPGADEDREGRPFVGASGQLLERMLLSIGQTRERFYVTNTVYWRPPGNRTPSDVEVALCLPFLRRQIEIIAPKILLLLGSHAVKHLIDSKLGITKSRGQWFDYVTSNARKIPSIVSFHPAYLLRVPAHKRLVWRDLCVLAEKLDQYQDKN
ncbi:MAG: uracil-DNA glycosylase, partial [Pseudomonadota bacterium]